MMAAVSTSPRPWSLIVSVLLHVAVVGLLLWGGFHSQTLQEQAPVALELWTTAPPPPAPSVVAQPKPTPVVEPPRPVVAEPPADVNLGRHKKPPEPPKLKPEPKLEPKPEPKPEPAKKPEPKKTDKPAEKKPEAKAPPAPAAKPQAKPKPSKTYNPEADDLLASLDSPRTSGKANARSDQAGSPNGVAGGASNGSSTAKAGWISRVKAKVTPLVQVPPELSGNPKVVLQVSLLPSLEVNRVQLLQSSGSKAYDDAVQRAIWEAKTFPALPPGANFNDGYRQFKMEFRPRS
ncbi:TonB C-terminal domain-containing protein [Chromobacterium haemolyticum]|uniref:TonB C-terminal domain-containing protein n=1 Tax=Chromobacterium fluminis TaxID=3044269 RepID=A0ABX0LC45_9NEIS|nr:energy transducer TonB [Chromobacterium haemolyticum]NHR08345.1 TonB C-terminal domain-containing protein [Chromobacterium haemolyticum]